MATLELIFKGQDGVGSIVNNINVEMNQLNETTNKAKESGSSFFSNMLSSAGGFIAANVVGAITSQVSDFVGSIGKVTMEEQDQMAQLQASLTSTGGAAGVTMDQLTDLAKAQADQTKFSVAQTEAIEKVGLTFTSINKDIFPQTVQLAEDMSAKLGIQGSLAMTMLGKASDDPIKGMAALHKTGTSFTEQQVEQIKALTASGDKLGAYQIILHEVANEYGGSATAAAKTFSGQQEVLAHQMDEVKVKIGSAVLPILGQLTSFVSANVIPVLSTFADWFADNLPSAVQSVQDTLAPFIATVGDLAAMFQKGAEDGGGFAGGLSQLLYSLDSISPIFDDVGDAVNMVADAFDQAGGVSGILQTDIKELQAVWAALAPSVTATVNAVEGVVMSVFGVIQTFIAAHGNEISADMTQAWTRIQAIIKSGIELYNAIVPPVLKAIDGYIKAHGADIQAILGATWNAIKAAIDIALTLIQGVITIALDLIHGNWQKAWEDIKTMSATIVTDLITIIKADLEILKTVFAGAIKWIGDEWKALPGQLSGVGNAIVKTVQDGFESAWENFKAAALKKLQSFRDQMPFSEPKDSSSPLYGLGKSGAAIIANMQAGLDGAPKLNIGGALALGSGGQISSGSGNRGGGGGSDGSGGSGVQRVLIELDDRKASKNFKSTVNVSVDDNIKGKGQKALARQLTGG